MIVIEAATALLLIGRVTARYISSREVQVSGSKRTFMGRPYTVCN